MLQAFLDYERFNAFAAWLLVGLLVISAIGSVYAGDPLWAGLAAVTAALVVLPAVTTRDWTVMVPWEVVLFAALPTAVRTVGGVAEWTVYLAVPALALIVAVELDAFTDVEMTPEFAVAFVVLATMAIAGVWAVAQHASDLYLGTALLDDQRDLMWELVAATVVGGMAGAIFELYVRRHSPGRALGDDFRREVG